MPNIPSLRRLFKLLGAVAAATALSAGLAVPTAAMTTTNLGYIFSFGLGANDPAFLGSSIWVNALTGVVPGASYTPSGGSPAVITNVPAATVDAGGLPTIATFDTLVLYEVCDIGSHPGLVAALNTYLTTGLGKVVIYDGDKCTGATTPNYSSFLFPFTTANPGPRGATGSYTFVESNTLTTGLSVGPVPGNDALGDANTFITFNGAWCKSLVAQSSLQTGITEAYAQTAAGGLVVYEGEDNWFDFGPDPHQKLVFDNILKQQFKPATGLPCAASASGITLSPPSASNPVGGTHTVTATVVDQNNNPSPGVTVTFRVVSGPNIGQTGTGVTNASGQVSFTYADTGGAGTDNITASFTDPAGNVHTSNTATKAWVGAADTIPPTCVLTSSTAGPPAQIVVTVQDADDGLATITHTETNATVVVDAFTAGTTSPVNITATKIDDTLGATLSVTATDVSGNTTICDPTLHTDGTGKPTQVTVDGSEGKVTIANSGLKSLTIEANGQTFTLRDIASQTNLTLDISSALTAGSNVVTVHGRGSNGTSALLVFSS